MTAEMLKIINIFPYIVRTLIFVLSREVVVKVYLDPLGLRFTDTAINVAIFGYTVRV